MQALQKGSSSRSESLWLVLKQERKCFSIYNAKAGGQDTVEDLN